MGSMTVQERYTIDKTYECKQVFKTTDTQHPGVAKVMAQGEVNLAGSVKVFSESYYPELYKEVYLRPAQTREIFQNKGWNTVAALQLRNPMHRSHEYLAKVAIEICDGVLIHQLIGKLKPGDIPAEVRVRAVNALVENYFVKDTCIQAGYPMEMRYILPLQGSRTRQFVERRLKAAGVTLRIVMQLPGTEAVKKAVEANLGIAFVSRYSVENECTLGKLKIIDIERVDLTRHMELIYRKQKYFAPVAQRFREFAHAYAKQHLTQSRRNVKRVIKPVD